jgi:hypothetical protein
LDRNTVVDTSMKFERCGSGQPSPVPPMTTQMPPLPLPLLLPLPALVSDSQQHLYYHRPPLQMQAEWPDGLIKTLII